MVFQPYLAQRTGLFRSVVKGLVWAIYICLSLSLSYALYMFLQTMHCTNLKWIARHNYGALHFCGVHLQHHPPGSCKIKHSKRGPLQ